MIISAEDWRSIEEALFINQMPDMTASIYDPANESFAQGVRFQDLDW